MKCIYMLQLGWTLKTLCKEKNPDTKNHIVYNSLYRKYPRKGKSIETVDSQEQSWKYYTYWFQAILQSYINKKKHGTGTKTGIQNNGSELRVWK